MSTDTTFEPIEDIQHIGFGVLGYVTRDPEPPNPRVEFDRVGRMVCWHDRYTLGDEQPSEPPMEWLESEAGLVVLPLYLLDHSGLSISTVPFGDPWDSGQIGWIVASRDNGEFMPGTTDDQIRQVLRLEVQEYDRYLRGDYYGIVVERDGQVIESLWGIDDREYADQVLGDYLEAHTDTDLSQMRVYVCDVVTEHFRFQTVGSTPDNARTAMVRTLMAHGLEYGLAPDWFDDYDMEITTQRVDAVGTCDGEAINT